mmetsp:Transcript_2492/g.5942  ORF Transcript_2492/g.5942 Transcript_2492/m.5942 type:complete len:207 (+) Transcript_2492:945-1565(+)
MSPLSPCTRSTAASACRPVTEAALAGWRAQCPLMSSRKSSKRPWGSWRLQLDSSCRAGQDLARYRSRGCGRICGSSCWLTRQRCANCKNTGQPPCRNAWAGAASFGSSARHRCGVHFDGYCKGEALPPSRQRRNELIPEALQTAPPARRLTALLSGTVPGAQCGRGRHRTDGEDMPWQCDKEEASELIRNEEAGRSEPLAAYGPTS